MTAREQIIEMIESANDEDMKMIQETIIAFLTLTAAEKEALLPLRR